jgi:hypothetical protein
MNQRSAYSAAGIALTLIAATIACGDEATSAIEEADSLAVVLDRTVIILCPGDLATLDAVVSGDPTQTQRAVHFTTRDSGVVSVREQYGLQALLEGRGFGTTAVYASAVAEPGVVDSASVTVTGCTTPTPVVSILGMTVSGTGTPIDTSDVSGAVDVRLSVSDVTVPAIAQLRIGTDALIDCGAVESNPDEITCLFDTDARDAGGNALFPDGAYRISARIIRPDGIIIAETQRTLVLANG